MRVEEIFSTAARGGTYRCVTNTRFTERNTANALRLLLRRCRQKMLCIVYITALLVEFSALSDGTAAN